MKAVLGDFYLSEANEGFKEISFVCDFYSFNRILDHDLSYNDGFVLMFSERSFSVLSLGGERLIQKGFLSPLSKSELNQLKLELATKHKEFIENLVANVEGKSQLN